jgi:filamentous hemagglutinin family protein
MLNCLVLSDKSLDSKVTIQGNTLQIDGGTKSKDGLNLFHSLQEFSVLVNQIAHFNNDSDVKNIFVRITGDAITNINGIIRSNGSVNIFLIDSDGIILEKNAALDIGGSFLATTAEKIVFAGGAEFKIKDISEVPLLTVGDPVSLVTDKNTGSISVHSTSLKVSNGNFLALVGNGLNLEDSSNLIAKNGAIELISVDSDSSVDIKDITMGCKFNYLGISKWKNINLNNANIEANNIKIQGQEIVLSDRSTIVSNVGDIDIVTRKLVVKNGATISTSIFSGSSNAGNIHIRASESVELIGTFLDPENPDPLDEISSGIFVNALVLEAGLKLTGNAGNLILETATLVIKDGAHIESVTTGQGNGGVIEINATDSILLSNTSPTSGYDLRSGIFASSSSSNRDTRTTGNVGQININTKNLVIEKLATVSANNFELGEGGEINVNVDNLILLDGGYIEAGTFGDGDGGTLNVNAKNSIEISGIGKTFVNINGIESYFSSESKLSARSGLILTDLDGNTFDKCIGKGIAGNLTISTPQLIIKDGAQIIVDSLSTSSAGNINLDARTIVLGENQSNTSIITACAKAGTDGNINIDTATEGLPTSSKINGVVKINIAA